MITMIKNDKILCQPSLIMGDAKKEKIKQEHDFYFEEEEIHLYDADAFISQVKHLMVGVVDDLEFAIYFGINKNDCLDVWLRDENGVMYQVELRALNDDNTELVLSERVEEDDEEPTSP